MACDLSISLEFRDANEDPYYSCEVLQMEDGITVLDNFLALGSLRVYYSLEKDQFEVIPIHISQYETVGDTRIKYNPDLYKAPFFVKDEAHFNCTIFLVLNSWNIFSQITKDYLIPLRILDSAYMNCPDSVSSFRDLKNQVQKLHDQR